jgi:hypothetical protein
MLKKDIKLVVNHFKRGMRYSDVKRQLQAEYDKSYAFSILQKGFLRYRYLKARNNVLANLSYIIISALLLWSATGKFIFNDGEKYIKIVTATVLLAIAIFNSYKTLKEYREASMES